MVKKTSKTEQITSNIPTHWELAMWVAQGKGEVLDTCNFNRVLHSFDYRSQDEDRPLAELELNQYKVRLYGDTFWHDADRRYMDILRWNFVKFVKYIGSKFPQDTFNLQHFVFNSTFYIKGKFIANTLGLSICRHGSLDDLPYQLSWEAVKDKEVKNIETAIRKALEKEDICKD